MALDLNVTGVTQVFCGYYVHHSAHEWESLTSLEFHCTGWAGMTTDHKHKLELIRSTKRRYHFECTECGHKVEYEKKTIKRLLTKDPKKWFVWRR